MVDDLGGRLLRAGLVTRDQLAETLAAGPASGGALVAALAARGIPEDALAGFFLAEGFGPLMEPDDLAQAEPSALRRLPASVALDLLALPVRASPGGLVVAFAAPSDRHSVREISRMVGGQVLPTVACVGSLRDALGRFYPAQGYDEAGDGDTAPVDHGRRSAPAASGDWAASSRSSAPSSKPRAPTQPPAPADDEPVPLVRVKPRGAPTIAEAPPIATTPEVPNKFARRVITQSFMRPDVAAIARTAGSRRKTADFPAPSLPPAALEKPEDDGRDTIEIPIKVEVPPEPRRPDLAPPEPAGIEELGTFSASLVPDEPLARLPTAAEIAQRGSITAPPLRTLPPPSPPVDDRWDTPERPALLPEPAPPPQPRARPLNKLSPSSLPVRGKERPRPDAQLPVPVRAPGAPPPGPRQGPAEVGSILAAIRAATDRDDVVRLACEGAVTVARSAIFLALRQGVLKGWEGAGAGISRDAVRNLWIPTSSPSTFKRVVERSESFVGAYGTAMADTLFRAAVASRGGDLMIAPVSVATKVVGVIAVDDLASGSLPRHRIELLASAIGEAFERIIAERRG